MILFTLVIQHLLWISCTATSVMISNQTAGFYTEEDEKWKKILANQSMEQ